MSRSLHPESTRSTSFALKQQFICPSTSSATVMVTCPHRLYKLNVKNKIPASSLRSNLNVFTQFGRAAWSALPWISFLWMKLKISKKFGFVKASLPYLECQLLNRLIWLKFSMTSLTPDVTLVIYFSLQ